jgi:hypothetical protein
MKRGEAAKPQLLVRGSGSEQPLAADQKTKSLKDHGTAESANRRRSRR